MRTRPLIAAAALMAASLAGAGSSPATAQAAPGCEADANPVDVLQTVLGNTSYTVHTDFTKGDGTVVSKDTPAVVGVPTPVHVRAPGAGLPDLLVTVLPNLDRSVTISVLKAPSAPAQLPVRVEAVFALEGGTKARLGYDAAEVADPAPDDPFRQAVTTAPASWNLNAAIERCDAGTFLDLTQTTAARTAPLAMVGAVSTGTDSTEAELALAPVPSSTTLTASITKDASADTETAEFGIAPNATTAATVDARLVAGRTAVGPTTNVHAELPGLPAAPADGRSAVVRSIAQETTGTDRHRLEFDAVKRLERARVVLRQREGTRQRLDATAEAVNLPHAFSVDIAEITEAGLTRHELRYASQPFKGLTEKLDRLDVDADIFDAQESTDLDADTTSIRAGAAGVPADLVVSFTPPDAEAPEFLATSLSTSPSGGATGPPLDSLEVEVARDDDASELGDGETLTGEEEGVLARTILLEDRLQRRQTVHLFVTKPKLLSFRKSAAPAPGEVGVDQDVVNARMVTDASAPDRPFRVRLERTLVHRQPVVFSEASIDPLPADVTVNTLAKKASGAQILQSVDYTATEPTDRIEFSTDEGARDVLRAELHSVRDTDGILRRVPKEIDFCLSPRTGRCSGAVLTSAQRNQPGVSLKVSTPAGELHGSFLDCVDGPLTGECTATNASRFKSATFNIGARASFALDIDAPPVRGGEKGHVFIDTDNSLITSGSVNLRDVSSDPCAPGNRVVRGTLRDVKAEDRFAVIEVENADCLETGIALSAERGSMSCGPGTVIDLAADKVGGNVANDFCRTP